MTSSLEAAGAVREPSEYATLSMDRHITGLWTQRSPLRDADVPYLYNKFYSASRFDSLIDGINREVTAKLTNARRAGHSVYNNQTFPAINSYYSYKRILNGSEIVRVMADGQDGTVYDATAGQQAAILTKGAGAGKARFQGVNESLYITDGVENVVWKQPAPWAASTQYSIGDTVLDTSGNVQYLSEIFEIGSIVSGTGGGFSISGKIVTLLFSGAVNFNIAVGTSFYLSGMTATYLNNTRFVALTVNGSTVTAFLDHVDVAFTGDNGQALTYELDTTGKSGITPPIWNGVGVQTADGTNPILLWTNYGKGPFPWGIAAPVNPPILSNASVTPLSPMLFWQPSTAFTAPTYIVSETGYVWYVSDPGTSGWKIPTFDITAKFGQVKDNSLNWLFAPWFGSGVGTPGTGPTSWQATTSAVPPSPAHLVVLVDKNGNLQAASSGTTGGAEPTWNTIVGGTTTDGSATWQNIGPYLALAFQGFKYGYAYHTIDRGWSTLSPLSPSTNGVIDGVGLSGAYSTSSICDSVGIFRTADGQATPLLLALFPNVIAGGTWTFADQNPDFNLDEFTAGPQNHANDAPPVGITAPLFHLGRMWVIYKNTVLVSGGPDTLVGNGLTSFPPTNEFSFPEQPIRLFSGQTSLGPTVFVWCTSNIWAIPGAGSVTSPFQQPSIYMGDVGIQSYDAVCVVGSSHYAFTTKKKFAMLDPGAGYVEAGFPIGDQFKNVTTGTGAQTPTNAPVGALYSPSSTFVTWAELGSGDSAIYAADGAVGWFRYSPVTSPESGFLWSPRAVIAGGTSAVQAIETSPGITQLLIGPKALTTGPILFRDSTVFTDNGNPYPSYDVKGNIVLCQSGEVAEIAHIGVKSAAVGSKPVVGLLLGELAPTLDTPFDWLAATSNDPPDLPASETMYSDRYTALQNGVCPKCDNFQLAIDYGTQPVGDETLLFSVYGAKHAERRQQ